jgi:UDP-glucose 4-epimerase
MKILLTGGAGIGAVTAGVEARAEVLVYDHFVSHSPSKLEYSLCSRWILDQNTRKHSLSSPRLVMHFAAYIQMGESVVNPRKYYDNNWLGTMSLVESMIRWLPQTSLCEYCRGVW